MRQRLVSGALGLRLIQGGLRDDQGGMRELLEAAGAELDAALDELRELARGLHPAVLSDRGLDDRVAALDGRLELRSTGGGGTVLRADIPVPPASGTAD